MKKLLPLLLLLVSVNAYAQDPMPYTAETFTDDYIPLANWFPLNVDEMWDVPMVPLNLQFGFPCFGDTADLVWLSDIGGGVEMHMPDGELHLLSITNADFNDVLNVLDPDSAEGSTHRYLTEGTSPNMIYKLEFNNVGFDWEMANTGGAASVADVQVWFYENGDMEIRYGPHTIVDMADVNFWGTASAGLSSYWDFYDFTSNFLWATGDASEPEFPLYIDVEYDSLQISPIFSGIDNWPSDGQVYRFNYDLAPIINVDELTKTRLKVFPNPASDFINLEFPDPESRTVEVYDSKGRLVEQNLSSGISSIDLRALKSGVHQVWTDKGENVTFIVK